MVVSGFKMVGLCPAIVPFKAGIRRKELRPENGLLSFVLAMVLLIALSLFLAVNVSVVALKGLASGLCAVFMKPLFMSATVLSLLLMTMITFLWTYL